MMDTAEDSFLSHVNKFIEIFLNERVAYESKLCFSIRYLNTLLTLYREELAT